jgi:hypothetical protein
LTSIGGVKSTVDNVFASDESFSIFLGDGAEAGHVLNSPVVDEEPVVLTVGLAILFAVPFS